MGVGYVIVIFGVSLLISSLALSVYPLLMHWSTARANDWLNNSTGAEFIYVVIAETIVISAVLIFMKFYKTPFRVIGLRKPKWSDPVWGFAMVVPYFIVFGLVFAVLGYLVPSLNINQKQQLGFNNVHGGGAILMAFISLVVLPPIAEEIMVRGFLYSSFKKAIPVLWAVLATSVVFALPHVFEGGSGGLLYVAGIDTFILSLFLIYLREATGGLWASMTLHAIKNGVAFMALFAFHLR